MGTATHFLSIAAKKLGIPYRFIDEDKSVLLLHFPAKDHIIVNTKLGLITNAEEVLGLDKTYQYELLKDILPLPKTTSYLDAQSKYGKFARFTSITDIQNDITKNFSFPLVIKKNRGTEGVHVFLVHTKKELVEKIETIFNLHDSEYDYILLAQEYIKPRTEYRVVVYKQRIALAYIKDNSQAIFRGNLSPLHWDRAETREVTSASKLAQLHKICQKLFAVWPLSYGGLDIIEDESGKLYLIEVNTSPSLAFFIRDHGEHKVIALYEDILHELREKYSK